MEKKDRKRNHAAAGILLDLVLVWALFQYFNFPAYLLLFAAVCLGFVMKRTAKIKNRRLLLGCAVFSFLLSVSFLIGGKADAIQKTGFRVFRSDFVYLAALTAAFFFISAWAADWVLRHPIRLAGKNRFSPGTVWAACSVFLFLSWIPCLFVYYPGNISPDSLVCITQAAGRSGLSNWQPVFYILLIRPFLFFALSIGKSLNFGAALFLAFQAAAMAVMVGYLPCWLTRKGFPLWISAAAMAYFIFDPVFPMYAVTMWKDVPFGALMLLYVLNLFDIIKSRGEWLKNTRSFVWFLILNLLIAFLRNNGYYIIFVTLAVLAFLYRKQWKRLVPSFLAILVIVPVIQGPVYRVCGVARSPFAESVGIPLQQIGRTVATQGKITEEQKKFLNRLLPLDEIKKDYLPTISDPIKFDPAFNDDFLNKNKFGFLKVWGGMMIPNFKSYAEAYVLQTFGFWHVGTTNWVLHYGIADDPGMRENGLSMSNLGSLAGNRSSIQNAFDCLQKKIPLLSGIVNIGVLFWAAVFSACLLIIRKKAKFLAAYLPLLVLWGTLMAATPTYCEFRYMFAFALALPVVVILAFPLRRNIRPSGRAANSTGRA
jgi:hypothetical protein